MHKYQKISKAQRDLLIKASDIELHYVEGQENGKGLVANCKTWDKIKCRILFLFYS